MTALAPQPRLDDIRADVRTLDIPDVPAKPMLIALLVAQRACDDMLDAIRAVGRRLEDHVDLAPQQLWTSWGEPDLLPLLDRLASKLQTEESVGSIGSILFEDISGACAALGWFTLDPVFPRKTAFDATAHRAIDRVVDQQHAGLVVELLRPGRRALRGGLLEPSHVVIAIGGAS